MRHYFIPSQLVLNPGNGNYFRFFPPENAVGVRALRLWLWTPCWLQCHELTIELNHGDTRIFRGDPRVLAKMLPETGRECLLAFDVGHPVIRNGYLQVWLEACTRENIPAHLPLATDLLMDHGLMVDTVLLRQLANGPTWPVIIDGLVEFEADVEMEG
jgi:hypothetical protein